MGKRAQGGRGWRRRAAKLLLCLLLVACALPAMSYADEISGTEPLEVDGSDVQQLEAQSDEDDQLPAQNLTSGSTQPMGTFDYIDENGQEGEIDCEYVKDAEGWSQYFDGDYWVRVSDNVAIIGSFSVDTLLIRSDTTAVLLADGVTVTAKRVVMSNEDRIGSRDKPAKLRIFGGPRGTGTIRIDSESSYSEGIFVGGYDGYGVGGPTFDLYGGTLSIAKKSGRAISVVGETDETGTITIHRGTLSVEGSAEYGLYAPAGVTIEGGTVTAEATHAGICVDRGTFSMTGGQLDASGTGEQGAGILTVGGATIQDGAVTAVGKAGGILIDKWAWRDATISISGGNVRGTSKGSGAGIGACGVGNVHITGGNVRGEAESGAGIGAAANGGNCGIVIEGGTTSGTSTTGAGIGMGFGGSGSSVTISGGTVTGSSMWGAGIGGAQNGSGCDVAITGGEVNASSTAGAAIGGGYGGNGGIVAIGGGEVHADAGSGGDSSGFSSGGAAIGGGDSCTGYTVQITEGTVYATAKGGAGIGGGENGQGGTVTIGGGAVQATSNGNGACIGSAYNSDVCDVTITGGTVYAGLFDGGGETDGAGIGGGAYSKAGTITISGGTVLARSAWGGAGIGGGYGASGGTVSISGGTVTAWAQQKDDALSEGFHRRDGSQSAGAPRAGDAQAIGCGEEATKSGTLSLDYPVISGTQTVPAKVWWGSVDGEQTKQLVVVTPDKDERVDSCRNPWVRVALCTHDDATTTKVDNTYHRTVCKGCGYDSGLVRHDIGMRYDEHEHWTECSACDYGGAHEAHYGATAASPYCQVCHYQYYHPSTYTVSIPARVDLDGPSESVRVTDVFIGDDHPGMSLVVSADAQVTLANQADQSVTFDSAVSFPQLRTTGEDCMQAIGFAVPSQVQAGSYQGELTFVVGFEK